MLRKSAMLGATSTGTCTAPQNFAQDEDGIATAIESIKIHITDALVPCPTSVNSRPLEDGASASSVEQGLSRTTAVKAGMGFRSSHILVDGLYRNHLWHIA